MMAAARLGLSNFSSSLRASAAFESRSVPTNEAGQNWRKRRGRGGGERCFGPKGIVRFRPADRESEPPLLRTGAQSSRRIVVRASDSRIANAERSRGSDSQTRERAEAASPQQGVLKDGFAGLAALKAQLERQRQRPRPRTADGRHNATGEEQDRGSAPGGSAAEDIEESGSRRAPRVSPSRMRVSAADSAARDETARRDGPQGDRTPNNIRNALPRSSRDERSDSFGNSAARESESAERRDRQQDRDVVKDNSWSSPGKSRASAANSGSQQTRERKDGRRVGTIAADNRRASWSSPDEKRASKVGSATQNRNERRDGKISSESRHFSLAPTEGERTAKENAADSSRGYESEDDGGKLTGEIVMEALQRAAAVRDSGKSRPRRRRGRPGSQTRSGSDSDSEHESSEQEPLRPLVFNAEWGARIQELESEMQRLRHLL